MATPATRAEAGNRAGRPSPGVAGRGARKLPRPAVLPLFRVALAAHAIPPRWSIAEQVVTLPAVDAEQACLFAVRMAHADASVPPWRPCVRASMAHATAEPVEGPKVAPLPARRAETQLSLLDPLDSDIGAPLPLSVAPRQGHDATAAELETAA